MKPKYTALIPFGIFLTIFILLNIIYNDVTICKDNFPLFAAIIAIISSFFTFRKNESLNEKVEVFIAGCTQTIVIHMCYIFYASTVFTAILEQTGGIKSAVAISLLVIPAWCIVPGLFAVASLFSLTVGTSMGAIAAFMPIAVSIAHQAGINPSLVAATIVCGAMFGDNLSILSDTTIAAVKITGSSMQEKLRLNILIAAPAFIASLAVLAYQNYHTSSCLNMAYHSGINYFDIIKIIPYIVTFGLALTGLDILIVLVFGTSLAISIGIWLQSMTCLQAINILFDGFYTSKGMVNVFILVLLLAGLSKIITHNGGIDYVIEKLSHKITGPMQAKIAIFFLVSAINITIAINTIAILITGPIANKIGKDNKIEPEQTACLLDIGSCVSQGILPYAPQLLLAASIAQVSAVSLLPYLYYQYFLTISLFVVILWKSRK
jgi:Na+/H+ antiporter NhaC